jgi:hypothetical protein
MTEVFIVYGISDCPSCLRACADLMEDDKQYVFVNTDFSRDYRTTLCKKFAWKTMPIVVRLESEEEILIGGHTELARWLIDRP